MCGFWLKDQVSAAGGTLDSRDLTPVCGSQGSGSLLPSQAHLLTHPCRTNRVLFLALKSIYKQMLSVSLPSCSHARGGRPPHAEKHTLTNPDSEPPGVSVFLISSLGPSHHHHPSDSNRMETKSGA